MIIGNNLGKTREKLSTPEDADRRNGECRVRIAECGNVVDASMTAQREVGTQKVSSENENQIPGFSDRRQIIQR
jgi:hypothetical protein